jgi:hypothetical protein
MYALEYELSSGLLQHEKNLTIVLFISSSGDFISRLKLSDSGIGNRKRVGLGYTATYVFISNVRMEQWEHDVEERGSCYNL